MRKIVFEPIIILGLSSQLNLHTSIIIIIIIVPSFNHTQAACLARAGQASSIITQFCYDTQLGVFR